MQERFLEIGIRMTYETPGVRYRLVAIHTGLVAGGKIFHGIEGFALAKRGAVDVSTQNGTAIPNLIGHFFSRRSGIHI